MKGAHVAEGSKLTTDYKEIWANLQREDPSMVNPVFASAPKQSLVSSCGESISMRCAPPTCTLCNL